MEIPGKYIDLFEAYVQEQLSEGEVKDFEARLNYDSEMKQAFEQYTAVTTGLRQHYRSELKQKLNEIDKELDKEKPKPKMAKLIWISSAVAATILIGLLVVGLFGESANTRLAKKYWPAEEGLPVRMSKKNQYDAAMNAYKQQQWAESKKLLLELPANDTTHYFLGIVSFRQKNFPEAIRFFEIVPESSHWYSESEYRMALSYLANGDIEKARVELRRIMELNTRHNQHAAKLLEEI